MQDSFIESLTRIINRTSATPVYEQIQKYIENSIKFGTLAPGFAFPPEREIVEILGITRPTLRQAFIHLEKDGYIRRRHAVGTFVDDRGSWRRSQSIKTVGVVTWRRELSHGYFSDLFGFLCMEAA